MSRRLKGLFRWTAFRVSALLSALLIALYIAKPPILELFELKAYDYRLQLRGELPTTDQVVIVAIDEKSLEELGQWPWPRIVMAQIIEALTQAGAKVIGLDIFWPEPEQRLGVIDSLYREKGAAGQIPLLRGLQGRLTQLASQNPEMDAFLREVSRTVHPDELLAEAIKASRRVVLGDFFLMNVEGTPHLQGETQQEKLHLISQSKYPIVRTSGSVREVPFMLRPYRIKGNVPVIARSARAFGYTTTIPDADGVLRSVPLVVAYGDHYLPALALQTLRYAGDPSSWILHLEPYGVEGIQWKRRWIPTTERGLMYINFRGRSRTFPYISAVDVLKGSISPDEIKDRIVLVGAVAEGIYDLRPTPVASVFPGVEIHANIIDNILRGDFIRRPEWARGYDLLLLLALGLGLGWIFDWLRPVFGALLMLFGFGAHAYFNTWMLTHHGTWLNVIFPSMMIPTSFLGVSVYKYIREEREKRKIRGAFQYYVPPSVVNQILKDPEALKLGGEEKVLTVLFCDIRGFTSISESLPPDELVRLLNEYFTEMTNVVFRNRGTLDKYIGDAIMAFYGAPLPLDDHPYRACSTALDMRDELKKLRVGSEPRGMGSLDIGIGINTGEMVVGNMGSQRRFDYTVMGDHVNLASRLEGLNKQYGTHIIMSEFTYLQVGEHLLCRELDWVRVKGKARPVQVYELLGRRSQKEDDRLWLETFTKGLAHYRNLEFDRAEECFQDVLKLRPDDQPSMLYLERCEHLRATTIPPGWDGVFEWETK